jgi:DNA adenine methylase
MLLAERLARLKGRFILSLNDRPEVRQTFKSFRIEREEITYTAQAKPGKRYGELLIMN